MIAMLLLSELLSLRCLMEVLSIIVFDGNTLNPPA